ncbi:MAG: fibronectin type III domain-containing protein [Patescibacteria group bacterium]|nr:fibronectin type III domain-containing protein [Patescibacteria group bacterium]
MIYSKIYLNQKQKISKFFFIFLILFSFFIFLNYFFYNNSPKPSKADLNFIKKIEITNLSPIQVNIFWQTSEKKISWIIYGENKNKLDKIAFDDRDTEINKKSYFNHYSTLKNLSPGKTYYFLIIIDNKKTINKYLSFKTPEIFSNLNKINTINGKIFENNLSPLNSGVILLNFNNKNIFPLSYLIKNSGEWIISLNSFYNKESFKEEIINLNQEVTLNIFSENNQETFIKTNLNKLINENNIFIIGKKYNFLENKENNVLSARDSYEFKKNTIDIIYPKENSFIPGKKPIIKGTALPFSYVLINIFSKDKKYSDIVKSDEDGIWNYFLDQDLSLGKYKLTILTENEKKEKIKLERNFTIIGNDVFEGRVLGTATDESNINITPKIITEIPTIFNTPTILNTKTQQTKTTVVDKIPGLGTVNFFYIFLSFIFIIFALGFLLFF